MDSIIEQVFKSVISGSEAAVAESVGEALQASTAVSSILNDGLIAAMNEVGDRFEAGDMFVPEMLISGRAMKAGVEILRPYLMETGVKPAGKVVIGTLQGDVHDIGKNLVGLMMEGAGFDVIDLGTDVSPEKFVEAVAAEKPDILGMSTLLTTTVANAAEVIKLLTESGLRSQVKIMFGGAPVTEDYANQIGADGYAADASGAARKAKELCNL